MSIEEGLKESGNVVFAKEVEVSALRLMLTTCFFFAQIS